MRLVTEAPVATGHTGVVVVGTGAAGLSALLHLAAAGVDCVAVTRGRVTDSATDWAQGGLAAVWDDADTLEAHVADTLTAGAGLCDEAAVRDLVASAPGAIRRLIALGARFDLAPSGELDLHLEGGHSARRIIHADGDSSGAEVERTLWEALRSGLEGSNTTVREDTRLVDILTDANGRACGVRLLHADGAISDLLADAVVLASGGIGQLWPVTSNPTGATGDGLAAALRAGAVARDVEFMQFHPTVLADDAATERGVLISEAVRGEGAFLVDGLGTRIMEGRHPLADLAPRDVVSAAIMAHLGETGEPYAFLDATAFGAAVWEERFPGILKLCRGRGVDPIGSPIPVHPAAHYSCGGVAASLDGRTCVPGLFAVGEVAATGVQGANRLASNSLTEALVAGDRVGRLLTEGPLPRPGLPVDRPATATISSGAVAGLKQAMQRHAFVERSAHGLGQLSALLASLPGGGEPIADETLTATNLHLCAVALAAAAAARTESRGCHRRLDHPESHVGWVRRIAVGLDASGSVSLTDAVPTPTERTAA